MIIRQRGSFAGFTSPIFLDFGAFSLVICDKCLVFFLFGFVFVEHSKTHIKDDETFYS